MFYDVNQGSNETETARDLERKQTSNSDEISNNNKTFQFNIISRQQHYMNSNTSTSGGAARLHQRQTQIIRAVIPTADAGEMECFKKTCDAICRQ